MPFDGTRVAASLGGSCVARGRRSRRIPAHMPMAPVTSLWTSSPAYARHKAWKTRGDVVGSKQKIPTRLSVPSAAADAPVVPVDPCEFVREAVERATGSDYFVISETVVKTLASTRGLDPIDLLPEFVREAQKLAIPPTSKFHVGAAALGSTGAVYLGVNVELPGLPLNASIHAEQFAVVTAMRHGETKLIAVATTAAPCGHCRQFMNELRDASKMRIIIPDDSRSNGMSIRSHLVMPLCDLLPHSFGPLDLTHDNSLPLLLEKRNNGLRVVMDQTEKILPDVETQIQLALREANVSYAPYSESPAGLVLVTKSGDVFPGRAVESAAYNPTMSPLHVALCAAVAMGNLGNKNGGGWGEIEKCILVEIANAPVQYCDTVKLILKTIAPHGEVTVVSASRE